MTGNSTTRWSDRVRGGLLQCAVGVPNVGMFGDPEVLVELAESAEDAGWDGLYLWDHVLYHDQSWPLADSTVALAAIAARTTRLRLGILMNAVPRRRPQKLAREAVTLDRLSHGRLVFGVGLGSMPEEYSAFGEDPDLRVRGARLNDALQVITALWAGTAVTHSSSHYVVTDVVMRPTPVQVPRIPVWCAGRWPARAPFRRAAHYDGVMPTTHGYGKGSTMPPEQLHQILTVIEAERGHLDGYDVALEGATDGTSDDRGAETLAPYIAVGMTWWVEALGWWRGDLQAARRRIDQGPPRLT